MKTLPPALLQEFGRKLKKLMHERGIHDNGDLARRVSKIAGWKVRRQAIWKWVNGHSYPFDSHREALAKALGVPVSEITYSYTDAGRVRPAQLSDARVPFRWTPDPHNPALVRAEMSDVLTVAQAEEIARILGMTPKK